MQRIVPRSLQVAAGCCALLLLGLSGGLPVSAASSRVDPTCAGQPHGYLLLSAPIVFARQVRGSIQLWYAPACRTSWARTVAGVPALLLSATLTLPGGAPYLRATWDGRPVRSPQVFTPVLRVRACGQILRVGQLASGCLDLFAARRQAWMS
ncbi:MAG TPA: hypothetical protein VGF67_11145 [Ktedonobacteraceae bacterium]|jgi:hypothetical protein